MAIAKVIESPNDNAVAEHGNCKVKMSYNYPNLQFDFFWKTDGEEIHVATFSAKSKIGMSGRRELFGVITPVTSDYDKRITDTLIKKIKNALIQMKYNII
jgi:hypothetical protein